jgi:hypothetical protein
MRRQFQFDQPAVLVVLVQGPWFGHEDSVKADINISCALSVCYRHKSVRNDVPPRVFEEAHTVDCGLWQFTRFLLFHLELHRLDEEFVAHLDRDVVVAGLDLRHLRRNFVVALVFNGDFIIILVIGQIHGRNRRLA